jgi:hypothetical protein
MRETSREVIPAATAGETAEVGYYRADYGHYAPDWIPRPDDVSLAAWNRYLASKPGSRKHRAAYAAMHQEVGGRGFPGPDLHWSYLADHGYKTGADWIRAHEGALEGIEPADAWAADLEAEAELDRQPGPGVAHRDPVAGPAITADPDWRDQVIRSSSDAWMPRPIRSPEPEVQRSGERDGPEIGS